jgi:glucose/arabinose dehydrogenase
MNRFALLLLASAFLAAAHPNYSVESIPTPPTKHDTKQVDGITFLPDGRLAACLPSGEIFFYHTTAKTWHLFAEGLHNPLGIIPVSNSSVIVCQRPELTRVSDTDDDGKADFYEALSDDFGMSGNYHEFNFTPARDAEGNIFFGLGTGSSGNGIRAIVRGKFDPRGRPGRMHASTPYRGWVIKYTPDGQTIPWASGFRTPNGVGFDCLGNLFVSDNQGDWLGSSKLFHVKQGRHYGHVISLTWDPAFEGAPLETPVKKLDSLRTRACVVFPHGSMANSPTQPFCDTTGGKFGPFDGQLMVGEMNKPRIMRVLLEEIGGELQGAAVPFLDGDGLTGGCGRFAFAPDGSLWVGHTKHTWAGGEGLHRVTWSGETPFEIAAINLTESGFRFTFTKPVDPATANTAAAWPCKRFWYRYHRAYGSKQFELTDVAASAVRVAADGLSVEVDLTELKPWNIHEFRIEGLKAKDGSSLANAYIAYTLNRLLGETAPPPQQYE